MFGCSNDDCLAVLINSINLFIVFYIVDAFIIYLLRFHVLIFDEFSMFVFCNSYCSAMYCYVVINMVICLTSSQIQ